MTESKEESPLLGVSPEATALPRLVGSSICTRIVQCRGCRAKIWCAAAGSLAAAGFGDAVQLGVIVRLPRRRIEGR